MSIRFEEKPRMPQPEQWLSEHEPWSTLCIVFGTAAIATLVGWLFG